MTSHDEPAEKTEEKAIPPIGPELDAPLVKEDLEPETKQTESSLRKRDDLDAEITRFRYKTGGKVLYVSMGAMGALVLADIVLGFFPGGSRTILENAFDTFKLITMTVLGYLFGASSSGRNK